MIFKSILYFSCFLAMTNCCYGSGEWIPINTTNIVVQETVPQIVIPPPIPQPTIIYQWTPHVIVEPIVVTKKRIFIQEQTIQMVPVTRWIYQPIVVYR